ncbi:polyubiquitin, partial [Russula aff. rugulosa BPL654]
IFVEDFWHIALAYDVSLDSPISSLKAAIQEAEGIPVAWQYLKFQGQDLEDTTNFSSYNISDGSIVQLRRKPNQVFVNTWTGKILTCEVDLDEPTLFLQMIVKEIEGIPVGRLSRLIFNGIQLEDHRTLTSYKIQKEATLYLVKRLRGGGPVSNALAYAVACCPWDGDMKARIPNS